MKNTLIHIPKCKTCQMELIPYRDINDDIQRPKDFCDHRCREAWTRWSKYFIKDRMLSEMNTQLSEKSTGRTSQVIDLRI